MYINRTEPRLNADSATRKAVARKEKSPNGDSFSDTMASILEIDVVQVSDSTEEGEKKQQQNLPRERTDPEPQKADSPASQKSLDIKV